MSALSLLPGSPLLRALASVLTPLLPPHLTDEAFLHTIYVLSVSGPHPTLLVGSCPPSLQTPSLLSPSLPRVIPDATTMSGLCSTEGTDLFADLQEAG